jgi:hypothetical protein
MLQSCRHRYLVIDGASKNLDAPSGLAATRLLQKALVEKVATTAMVKNAHATFELICILSPAANQHDRTDNTASKNKFRLRNS